MGFRDLFVESLRCDLTPDEHKRKSEELAAGVAEVRTLEESKAAEVKRWKERIDDRTRRNHELAYDVRTGTELRPVECYEQPRFEALQVEVVRADSGALVRTRNMEPWERQIELVTGEEPTADESASEGPASGTRDTVKGPTN